MSEYTPRVGDKVRATLGENVIVGELWGWETRVPGILWDVRLPDGTSHVDLLSTDGWLFEEIVSVPSKFGAVIRRADGKVFMYAPGYEGDPCPWLTTSTRFFRSERATVGGFSVLFDGVDE